MAESIKPYVPQRGRFKPYIPPTLQDDYKQFLQTDIPNVNYTFEIIKDWYFAQEEGYEKYEIRASRFPINWKSKMGNADMSTNFFTHVDANIHKGDIVVQNGERYYMLNWVEQEQINSISTQMLECNTSLEIKRYFDEELDENAYLIEEAGYKTVVDAIPANFAKYAGRPDFTSLDGVPGVHADQLISGMVQYNSKTKLMKIGDMFEMDGEVYRIINFHLFEVNYTKTNGVINIEAKKAAGGWGKA